MTMPETDIAAAAALTPTEVGAAIRRQLRLLGDGRIAGEVRDLTRSGRHRYFAIADEDSSIRCIVWGSTWERLEHQPSEGEQIEAHFNKVDFWTPRGSVSLHLDAVELAGEGVFLRRQSETLARLIAAGLCAPERKPPLPRFPRKVGLIAAATGEARVDVVTALRNRFPAVEIVFCPAAVQGVNCVGSVIDALATLDLHPEVDVIVLARGGGAASELYPFSDERLCRTIAALRTPVVTSIGHTAQRPNCDEVATAAAPVPAAAAALVVPDATDLQTHLGDAESAFAGAAGRIGEQRAKADALAGLLAQLNPPAHARLRLDAHRGRLAALEAELPHRRRLIDQQTRLERATADLSHRLQSQGAGLPGQLQLLRREAAAHLDTAQRRQTALDQQLQTAAAQLASTLRDRRGGIVRRLPLVDERAISRVAFARAELAHRHELIDALDWRRRGLARLLDPTGRPLQHLDQLHPGNPLTIELLGGSADATVTAIHPTEPDEGGNQ